MFIMHYSLKGFWHSLLFFASRKNTKSLSCVCPLNIQGFSHWCWFEALHLIISWPGVQVISDGPHMYYCVVEHISEVTSDHVPEALSHPSASIRLAVQIP